MSATLTVKYECDDCGNTVSFTATADLYGDTCLQLPPRWGHCAKGVSGPDDLIDLCPDCVARYQAAGVPIQDFGDFGYTHFRLTFGEEAYQRALVS